MYKDRHRVLLSLVQGTFIAALVIAAVLPFSCRINEEGISIIGGDFSAPILEKFLVLDNRSVRLEFSEPVKLSGIVVSPRIEGISDSSRISYDENLAPSLSSAAGEFGRLEASIEESEDCRTFTVITAEETEVGKSYEVFGLVEDSIGNSLTFCLPFVGYNSRIPRLIITEVQIKYGKGTLKGETIYRSEYVELLAMEDGNLAGLVLESASDGHSKDFTFPAVNVKKGEIILVHPRSAGEGCINEAGDDLNLALAPHSAEGIRDFWSDKTDSHYNDSSDIIILRDTVNLCIMDAVMYAAEDAVEWKSALADVALEVELSGIYDSADISSASSSKGCTALKSLTRQNSAELLNFVLNSEEDYEFPFHSDEASWAVAACSPGRL